MTAPPPADDSPPAAPLAALLFARDRLGPHSESLVSRPEVQVGILSRLRSGFDLEDAVLGAVFRAAADDRHLADEFMAFFLSDLMRLGEATLSPALRRFLDTGDLVQSVLGDLWPELARVSYETRGRFLSYLRKRLQWKAGSRARKLKAGRRREDLRVDRDPADVAPPARNTSPPSAAQRQEERDELILRLLRLSDRDRDLLTLHLRGEPLEDIAVRLELSPAAARKALQRAVHRARRMP